MKPEEERRIRKEHEITVKYRGFVISDHWLNGTIVKDPRGFVLFKSLSIDAAKEQIDERLFESRS